MSVSYPSSLIHEYPGESVAYLNLCTSLVNRLPTWQNALRNQEQNHEQYDRLGKYWRHVIGELAKLSSEGRVFGQTQVGEWFLQLSTHAQHVHGQYGFKEAIDEFKLHLGWVMGLEPQGFLGFNTMAHQSSGLGQSQVY